MSTSTDTVSSPADRNELLAKQRKTIAVTGWGAGFRFVQPHNACFWIALALLLNGAWVFSTQVSSGFGVFAEAYTASLFSTGLFAAAFLFFLHRKDRWEHTPGRLALTAFLLGGLAVPWAIALPGNGALMSLYTKLFGQAWAEDWQAGLTAPLIEESAKGIAFLLMLGLAPVAIRTVYDGLIVGAYVGLGFQVFEDLLYGKNAAYRDFGVDQAGAVLHTFVLRSLSGIASHALFTALFSAGLIYLLGTIAQPRRVGRGLSLMATAVLVHLLWDSMGALSRGTGGVIILLMLGITAASIAALLIALRLAGGRERAWLRDLLAPEVADGTLTDAELTALTGHRKQIRAYVRSHENGMSRRKSKHVLRAARDLAHDIAVAGGTNSPQVEHSRGEITRLRS
jgi:RsiW-degrading membrane proteinase PrsW (M82 family)